MAMIWVFILSALALADASNKVCPIILRQIGQQQKEGENGQVTVGKFNLKSSFLLLRGGSEKNDQSKYHV